MNLSTFLWCVNYIYQNDKDPFYLRCRGTDFNTRICKFNTSGSEGGKIALDTKTGLLYNSVETAVPLTNTEYYDLEVTFGREMQFPEKRSDFTAALLHEHIRITGIKRFYN